jgi:hypothetical protein
MADTGDSVFDKAESLARRILERLGTKVDNKLAKSEHALQTRVIGALASKLEAAVEANLQEDEQGIRRVAPNQFKVSFTYEETSKLSPQYIESVGTELTATVFEYINNRRYVTSGPVVVEAGSRSVRHCNRNKGRLFNSAGLTIRIGRLYEPD